MGMLVMIYAAQVMDPQRSEVRVSEVYRSLGLEAGSKDVPASNASLPQLRDVASSVTQSVVYIETEVAASARALPDDENHNFDDPNWEQFFPRRRASTIGSGVIVSEDGYIITNNHVIAGTDDATIRVTLNDKRIFTARVRWQGIRLLTLAVLRKLESDGLPHVHRRRIARTWSRQLGGHG